MWPLNPLQLQQMKKTDRLKIYNKYGGHCAYCGKPIEYKDMQVDHKVPIYRGYGTLVGVERGTDDFSNLMPSCRSCNFRKGTLSVEEFRRELTKQFERIVKNSFQVRQSVDYGLLLLNPHDIEFYFEKHKID